MNVNRSAQRGMTLTGLIFAGLLIVLVAVVGMKVAPHVIDYGKIMAGIKAIAGDASMRSASVAEIRRAFDRRANIDQIDDVIRGTDIDVTKEGNELVLSFAYSRQIPLFGPVSLLIDFEGTSNR
ncbi:MAG: DUF4845 domain-containing protein [Rhodocyclaceae bacterium]|jgi:hypothetical protein|nr:DUF4845 domain-containing protein [Rhodocyclaceae bacterium]MBK6553255.1 DUF4845 domain-containing protein [Rhodocyclaceae bacterium]MBK9311728.1 DUF4845 domain-containing protein [Rhodocyclaceae bacterium]